MKSTRTIMFAGLIVILVGGFFVRTWMDRPLGQPLALETSTQAAAPTAARPAPTQTAARINRTPTIAATIAPTALPPTEIASVCGNTGSMRLLVIGLTTPTDEEQMGADAIRLVTIDFDQPSAAILTLPAMVWVDTPVLAGFGVDQIQLTAAYLVAYSHAGVSPTKSAPRKPPGRWLKRLPATSTSLRTTTSPWMKAHSSNM